MSKAFSFFDKRDYPTLDVKAGYAEWSKYYDEQVPGRIDLPVLDSLTTVDWASVKRAADLACGTGRIGVWLKAEKGVTCIDGVDLSPDMLGIARTKDIYDELVEADLTDTGLAQTYDLVMNVLAACHVADLDAMYAETARLLGPGGVFVLFDYHPFFMLNGIPTNFPTPDRGTIAIENQVHLFSDHFAAAAAHNMVLTEMHERIIDEEWVEVAPAFEKYLHQPVGFCMVWHHSFS